MTKGPANLLVSVQSMARGVSDRSMWLTDRNETMAIQVPPMTKATNPPATNARRRRDPKILASQIQAMARAPRTWKIQ